MAYGDYGAFVWKNGKRRTDKEDAPTFASDEETIGMPIGEIPSGERIWMYLIKKKEEKSSESEMTKELQSNSLEEQMVEWMNHPHHGILGDGNIRVMCHKQGLPTIYEATENGFRKVEFSEEKLHPYEYDDIRFSYKGYIFIFKSGYDSDEPYYAGMIEPDGTEWECQYDYEFGAGFEYKRKSERWALNSLEPEKENPIDSQENPIDSPEQEERE